MRKNEIKKLTQQYLKREVTDEEWEKAYSDAQRKLTWIINRYGDGDGERRKPYYLAKLVVEKIRENAFAKWSVEDTKWALAQERKGA